MSDRAFAVYVLHPPVLVALTVLMRGLAHSLIANVVLLTLTGLAASYVVADVARRIPGLRAIL